MTTYETDRDARYTDLETRYPLDSATAEGLYAITSEALAIQAEPKDRPWMDADQAGRFWATQLYQDRYYRAMPVVEQEEWQRGHEARYRQARQKLGR